MSDQLREALDYHARFPLNAPDAGSIKDDAMLDVIVEAARAYADLLDTIEEDWRSHPWLK